GFLPGVLFRAAMALGGTPQVFARSRARCINHRVALRPLPLHGLLTGFFAGIAYCFLFGLAARLLLRLDALGLFLLAFDLLGFRSTLFIFDAFGFFLLALFLGCSRLGLTCCCLCCLLL